MSWLQGEGWRFRRLAGLPPALQSRQDCGTAGCADCRLRGRKAADAVAASLSSPSRLRASGGAKAAAKTDWTPLAGRARPYGRTRTTRREIRAKSRRSSRARLRGVDYRRRRAVPHRSDGREAKFEPTKKGWIDAADAIDEWRDLEALRKAPRASPTHSSRAGLERAYVSFKPYKMTAKGLTVEINKGRVQAGPIR